MLQHWTQTGSELEKLVAEVTTALIIIIIININMISASSNDDISLFKGVREGELGCW